MISQIQGDVNYSIKMKIAIFCFFLLTNAVIGAGEVVLPIDQLKLGSSKHKLSVIVTKAPREPTSISITHNGKIFLIPKEVMAQFPDVQLPSVRILAHTPTGELPDGWLSDHTYIISFDYGDTEVHGHDKREVEVYARARLYCDKASYSGREKFVPEGDFKNRWKIFQPMLLKGDGFNGFVDGVECPVK